MEGLFALHVYYVTQLMYAVDMYIGYFLILTAVPTQDCTAADCYDFIEVHLGKIASHMWLFMLIFCCRSSTKFYCFKQVGQLTYFCHFNIMHTYVFFIVNYCVI